MEKGGIMSETEHPRRIGRSIGAVLAGIFVGVVLTLATDIVLHVAGVYPPLDQPIGTSQALLATSYRVVIGVAGAWLTARLAPSNPMKHALILGYVASVFLRTGGRPGSRPIGPCSTPWWAAL